MKWLKEINTQPNFQTKQKENWLTWAQKDKSWRIKGSHNTSNEKCESHYFKNKLLDLVSWGEWEKKKEERTKLAFIQWNTNVVEIIYFVFWYDANIFVVDFVSEKLFIWNFSFNASFIDENSEGGRLLEILRQNIRKSQKVDFFDFQGKKELWRLNPIQKLISIGAKCGCYIHYRFVN